MPIYFRYPPGVLVFFNEGPIKARLRRDTAACVCVLVLHPWFPVFRAFRGLVPHPHVGSGGTQNLARRVGSGRVGAGGFGISWVGSSRPDSTLPSRSHPTHDNESPCSFQRRPWEVFEISRVRLGRAGSGRIGSGRVGSGRVGSSLVRRFWNTTGRVESP